jgi:hypothetical protein
MKLDTPHHILATAALGLTFTAGCGERPADERAESQSPTEVEKTAEPAHPFADFHAELAPLPAVPETLDELPEGVNIIQFEMRLLTEAMQNILRLLADRRLDAIPGQISQVHPAYELAQYALAEGLYAPPVNPEAMDRFIELDELFHDDLRALVRAARDDDLAAATASYLELVNACTGCHQEFRFH